jgi:O-antigen/teichoic acid export membrane protein
VRAVNASVAANSLRVLCAQVAGNAGYFASVLLLARALPPAGRGTVAFVTVAALLTSRVAVLGSGDAGKVLAARRPEERARVLANLVALTAATGLAGAGIAVALLIQLPGAHPAGVGPPELALLAMGVVAVASGFAASSFLVGCSRFREYTRVVAAAPWLYAALLALLCSGGLTVRRALFAWVIAQGAPTALLWLACFREAGFAPPQARLLREAVGFGLRAWVGGLAYLLNARIDQIVLGLLAGEATLGVYAASVNASEVLFYVPSAVGAALLPALALSAPDALAATALRVFRAVALLTLGGVVPAALLGPLVIPLVFGAAYRASVVPFALLLPGALGFAANAVFSSALLASGAPGRSSLGPLVALSTGIALDLLLIPPLGASGAAIAASVALLCGGTAAACAFGVFRGLTPAALVPRRADLAALSGQLRSRLSARRAGARWS